MKINKRRLLFLSLGLAGIAITVILVLLALEDNLLYYKTPTDIFNKTLESSKFRLGGMVKTGSLFQEKEGTIHFVVTDYTQEIKVTFKGILPSLFREGQGVVAEGELIQNNSSYFFKAKTILAKHDENYMPPNIKK
jgi:cytochrome c-type biogenesis protein CcmE